MLDPYFARSAALAAAIAHAEGFWVPGAIPRRHSNPGDLLDSAGENRIFLTRTDGWGALLDQVGRMLHGESHVYHHGMTWRDVAQLWTGGDNAAAWCASVCADLEVAPNSTLGQFAGVTPSPPAATPPLPQTPASAAPES